MKANVLATVLGTSLALLLYTAHASAQAAPGTFADALNPSGFPDPEKLDQIWQVDPIGGQVSVSVPFPTAPQGGRGPIIPFSLLYNSGSTMTLQDTGTYAITATYTVSGVKWSPSPLESNPPGPSGPWVTSGPYFYEGSSGSVGDSSYSDPGSGSSIVYILGCDMLGPYNYTDETGVTHDTQLFYYSQHQPQGGLEVQSPSVNSACTDASNFAAWPSSQTIDGSAMLTSSSGSVNRPDGTMFTPVPAFGGGKATQYRLTDANGNYASLNLGNGLVSAVDALGRTSFTTNLPVGAPGQIPAGSYYVETTNASNQPQDYNITVSTKTTQSFTMPHPANPQEACYSCSTTEIGIAQPASNATFTAVTQIALPDGRSYSFDYDSTYGAISKITFPTGGYVRFSWTVRPYSWTPYGGYTAISDLVVTDVYLSAGDGTENHWQYDLTTNDPPTTGSVPSNTYSTVYAPDGSYTTYSYTSRFSSAISPALTCFAFAKAMSSESLPRYSCKPAFTSTYDENGRLIQTVDQAYTSHGLTSRLTTSIYDGASPMQRQVQYQYDQWDNVIEKDESDWYACSGSPCPPAATPPSAWLRQTFTQYAYQIGYGNNASDESAALTAAHVVDKPSQILVTGTNGQCSLVEYGYDETPLSGQTGDAINQSTSYPPSVVLGRGNQTSESRCANMSSCPATPPSAASACTQWLTTTHTYDLAGQMQSTTDPKGDTTTFSYGDNYYGSTVPGPTDGYVTTVVHPNSSHDTYQYYFRSGQMAAHIDGNSQTTSYSYLDNQNMGRLSAIGYPDNGGVTYSYDDGIPSVQATTLTGESAGNIVRTEVYDGLGRIHETQLADPYGPDLTDTAYDSMGRVYSLSNPYRGTGTTDLTTTLYDALGRPYQRTNPDSSTKIWKYAGNVTTLIDENLNNWQRTADGLNRLTQVLEPTGSSTAASWPTAYGYDTLGDLTSVNQVGDGSSSPRNRTFSYDSLGRLTNAFNPESGTTSYWYVDQSGQLCSGDPSSICRKTDARGVTETFTYDNMNRVISRAYSDGMTPTSCYYYDNPAAGANGIGHLWIELTQKASTPNCTSLPPSAPTGGGYLTERMVAQYDAMGRVLSEQQYTPWGALNNHPYPMNFTYDLAGNVTSLTAGATPAPAPGSSGLLLSSPSAPCNNGASFGTTTYVFVNCYDQAGRLTSVTTNTGIGPVGLFTANGYAPFGGLTGATYGSLSSSGTNGGYVSQTRTYDNRLHVTSETDAGNAVVSPTNSSATVTIVGTNR